MTKFRELLPLYAVVFLGFLGYALTITLFIPMLMNKHFLFLPTNISTSIRASLSGLLLAMYPLGQFIGSPIIGNFSDHFGRKKVLLISLCACAIGFAGMAVSIELHSVSLLFFSAFFTGLCESNMAISQSVIADRVKNPTDKTILIGYVYSACSLGYVIGPLLGGGIGHFLGFDIPFYVTAFFVLVVILWIHFVFQDNYIPTKSEAIKILKSIVAIKSIFHQKKLYQFYFINFVIFFSVQGLYRVVPLFVVDTWKPTVFIYSLLISFVSLLCLFANLFFLKKLAERFSTTRLLGALLIIGGILVVSIVLPNHFKWIWILYGLAVIPTVMALPTCTTWLSDQVPAENQGQVLGNNQALLVLGEASSAAIGGLIAAIFIPLPVVMMGIILLITGIYIAWNSRRGN